MNKIGQVTEILQGALGLKDEEVANKDVVWLARLAAMRLGKAETSNEFLRNRIKDMKEQYLVQDEV